MSIKTLYKKLFSTSVGRKVIQHIASILLIALVIGFLLFQVARHLFVASGGLNLLF